MNKSELEDGRWNLNEDDVMQEHFKDKEEKKELETLKKRLDKCEFLLQKLALNIDATEKNVLLKMILEYFNENK